MSPDIQAAIRLLKDNGYTVIAPSEDDSLFEKFWTLYGKKVDKRKAQQKWKRLSKKDKCAALEYIPKYVAATPDIQYRRNPTTFLNNRTWENDIIHPAGATPHKDIDFSKAIADAKPKEASVAYEEKRKRILGMIQLLKNNPRSSVRSAIVEMYSSGLLKEYNIDFVP